VRVGNTDETVGVAVPFDKYLLLGRVSVGGMAEVFLAKTFGAEGFERFVAIKRLLPQMMHNKEFIDMFIDEAKIAVQLNHANIAQIYELGKHAQQLFIALEYVHGKELRALAVRAKKLGRKIDPNVVAYIVAKAAEGLDYAHQKKGPSGLSLGIVHRDVSPQNILISFEGEVKLIDFGIAKAKDRISQTQVGVLKGKIGYMSPEQVMGIGIDQRSDLFSLGCVLYELITGERAFKGASDFSTFEKVRNAEYVPPSMHEVAIDPALDRIMRKVLAKDREHRYARGSELSADLQRFLARQDTPISADRVAEMMHTLFADEYAAESQKLGEYRAMKPPPELVGKEEEVLEEAEALIEDHTRVVSQAEVKTNTAKIAFAHENEDDDPEKNTVSEKLIVRRKETPPQRRSTDAHGNDSDIHAALRGRDARSETVVALTKRKSEVGPVRPRASSWSRAVGQVNDRGPVAMGEKAEITSTIDLARDDGFTTGEILLIAGAGVIAVLFVLGVYLYTMRGA
jgi:serine/threonine protein kinase